uniref:Uncharacterized protein n=1 Tax=Arundo donax TaxID=35708 RepID=A0A0A9BEN7_ARUDO
MHQVTRLRLGLNFFQYPFCILCFV